MQKSPPAILVRLPDELLRAVRLSAAIAGVSVGEFTRRALIAQASTVHAPGDRREGAPEAAEGVGHDPSRA